MITDRPDPAGQTLGDDQVAALGSVAVSGRIVDVLVGRAGAGKTTAMNALRRVWEADHGPGSVVGIAPSAVAAHALQADLGVATENTAKWWQDHQDHASAFRAEQLIIIDEATLAGTRTLDRITTHAATVGAKVLLVGDWAQLQSVDAGGAFALLVADRPDDLPDDPLGPVTGSDVQRLDVHRARWAVESARRATIGLTTLATLPRFGQHRQAQTL